MPEFAIHPPVHLTIHPDEPIRSLDAAAQVVRRHGGDHLDERSTSLLYRIERASTQEEVEDAGKAFRAWAEEHSLLLVPPEDAGS